MDATPVTKFVQIMAGSAGYGNQLYALDTNGRVWEYRRTMKDGDHWLLITNERRA